ncbi:efflux RND transporter periplasmic adaptor subunit [Flavobacterium muglaense]|uniref:Efflux RND transporter periplasmic adaptor subunit n=1 Tax=Flavobacterium muglaense TaxID=2764716 RepID=A0A923N1A1_9FLAO|nr:efflux RND transporter periplasmic adaptor subunit [Flavobacterium muglaense]MBC5838965.1 efflux RND transporter periplasmic adaptor subunit [Flavobacterium muglaense]MBC5845484.1 efflux RND transporter periplasmic adaptor subunit [Flavobacterium muglaense]
MKKNIIIKASIAIAVLAIAYFGFTFFSGSEIAAIKAETIKAKTGDVITTVTATGTLQPITEVSVGTQVSGVVQKIYVDYNSVVKQGQLLAELDKTTLNSAVVLAQAAYNGATNEQRYMQTVYSRQKTLFDNKVISKSDYDEALYQLNNAKSIVSQRASDLAKAKTNLSYANIYSPIDGVVLSRAVEEGQTVAASLSTPTLFTIAEDLSEMQVEANVDEADIGQVKQGQRVSFTVDAYQGEEFAGVITQVRLNPTTTSNVVTYTVVIKAENPDLKLKPGLTATITIYTLELKNVLTLEAKGVNFEPDMTVLNNYQKANGFSSVAEVGKSETATIWVMTSKGIASKAIKTGTSDGINVEILSGLSAGEEVVYNLKALTKTEAKSEAGDNESPFMPKPPGGKK